jgi:HEAT repeat protein
MTEKALDRRPKRDRWATLGIHKDERRLTGWLVALFATTQASHGLGANAADALFFTRFGVGQLPLMIAISGLAVMVFILLHATGLSYQGPRRWLGRATAVVVVWVVLEWVGVQVDVSGVYPFIWISTQVIMMVTLTIMWNAAGSACTTRQAKRLFPIFATAGVAGGVMGNLLTGPLAISLGTENILLVQGALLTGSVVLVTKARGLFYDEAQPEATSIRVDMVGALTAVRSSTLLRLAAGTAFCLSVLFFLIVFPFNEVVAASFDSEADVAGFLGLFSSVSTAATFLVSLLVTNKLFARVGIVVSLMIVPLVYLGGFGLWLGSFGLATAVAVRGVQWVAVNAVGGTAFTAVFNVLTGRRRGQVMAFMTAVPAQIGTTAAGLILIAGEGLSETLQFGMGLVIAIAAFALVIAMRPAYLTAVVGTVRKGLVGVFAVPHNGLITAVDGEARRVLEDQLDDSRPEARMVALSCLAQIDDETSVERIASHLGDESPAVRLHALRQLEERASSEEVEELAASALEDPDARVAAAAAAIVGGEEGNRVSGELMDGGKPAAVIAVLNELARSDEDLGIDAASLLTHPDPRIRAAAASVPSLATTAAEALLSCLDDPSTRVRDASARSLAKVESGRQVLIEILETGTVKATEAALDALTPMERFVPEVTTWARREASRAALLDSYRQALDRASATGTRDFLVRVLSRRVTTLERWVLLAMTTAESKEIMSVVERGVRSDDVEIKAQAIEAVETLGDREVTSVLLPILEGDTASSGMGDREALRPLSEDFDPWLRALSLRCLAETIESELEHLYRVSTEDESDLVRNAVPSLVPLPLEHMDTLNLMDRVLALQRVPMFSELDPEDLEAIAGVTTEVRYEPEDLIYREGEEGSEALVIIDGTAVVSTDRNDRREVITTYGAGQHVGELSLLGGGSRSADVIAGDDGLHGVVINKVDLLSILEERPTVALGMMATLAQRLVDQT